jgi:hypothetical protein
MGATAIQYQPRQFQALDLVRLTGWAVFAYLDEIAPIRLSSGTCSKIEQNRVSDFIRMRRQRLRSNGASSTGRCNTI